MGARKVVVANVGPIGCIPYMRDFYPDAGDKCVTFPNQLAQLFNTQLKCLIEELRTNLEGSLFVYADAYHIMEDILMNYNELGSVICFSNFPVSQYFFFIEVILNI